MLLGNLSTRCRISLELSLHFDDNISRFDHYFYYFGHNL